MENSYSTVTELPGNEASGEQLRRLCTRYYFAGDFCVGKNVLEVACGGGQGLGYLADKASRVAAGDIDEEILKFPREYYKDRPGIEIKEFDAESFPFEDESFDVVIFYEAIYYLKNPEKFFQEARRVLRTGGKLILGTVNKDWSDFNPSPFSHKYYSVPELFNFLEENDFQNIRFFGDTKVSSENLKDKIVSLLKRIAVRLHLVPKTMKTKALLKRIFFGKLMSLPPEIKEGMCDYVPPVLIGREVNIQYKVLLAVAEK